MRNRHPLAGAHRALRTSTDQTARLVILTEAWPKYDKTILVGNWHISAPLRRDGSPDSRGDSILGVAEGKVIELLGSRWATGLEALG